MKTAPRWEAVELEFSARDDVASPYLDVEFWAVFRHEDGTELMRPGFWDGDGVWRIRFASPVAAGAWTYRTFSRPPIDGLADQTGELVAAPGASGNRFHRHGFWRIPAGCRNLAHADDTPALLVADTAWALPWRAAPADCEHYARDRQAKGFNATLLMTMQPDRDARGPRDRTAPDGFDVAFEDLPDARLTRLNPEYFQRFDELVRILVAHEIAPVYQPVFHGYGWKGLRSAGNAIPPADYARYCRYLVARYGAMPAIWLLGADADGLAPGIDPAGREVERIDAYAQPTGLHYGPHHEPWAYQDRAWLDFQWCQTGHNGEHAPERVASMWEKLPAKAVANGEPTYEHIGEPGRGAGWWQGHEAWCNLTAGGTMGVVYGAGSLWQWRRDREEVHQPWCMAAAAGWRDALDFEGASIVGAISRVFAGLPFVEMRPDFCRTYGRRALHAPGLLLVVYLENGGSLGLTDRLDFPLDWRSFDPRTGAGLARGRAVDATTMPLPFPAGVPLVVVFAAFRD